jgi:hypothetical protein
MLSSGGKCKLVAVSKICLLCIVGFTSGIGDAHVRQNMGTQQVVSWASRNYFGHPKSLAENASKVGISQKNQSIKT